MAKARPTKADHEVFDGILVCTFTCSALPRRNQVFHCDCGRVFQGKLYTSTASFKKLPARRKQELIDHNYANDIVWEQIA